MTVSYSDKVSDANFACFLKLLGKWRGSIYKLIWTELLVFLILYYTLHVIYRFVLNESQQMSFEAIVNYCNYNGSLIPHTFVLGFYVKVVMDRWWKQYQTIPWPDPIAVYVSSLLRGQDNRGRLMRRTIMRYVCLCLTMVFTMISPVVKKRLPTLEHMRDIGLLQDNELRIINDMDELFPKHRKHWMPIVWASSIITRARKEGRIRDDSALQTLMEELNKFRGMATRLIHYDAISIPLVYTQVVSVAVYSYFISAALAQQWVERPNREGYTEAAIFYFPMFTMLEFVFYMGWLKVAEALICPFGEDDDDFNVDALIDRNLQVSYVIADEMNHEHPELFDENYWNIIFTTELRPFRESFQSSQSSRDSQEMSDLHDTGSEDSIKYKKFLNNLNTNLESLIRRQDAQQAELSQIYRREQWPPEDSESEHDVLGDGPDDSEDTDSNDVEISFLRMDEGMPVTQEDVENGEENNYGRHDELAEEEEMDEEGDVELENESSGIDYFELLRHERMLERAERARKRFVNAIETVQLPTDLNVEDIFSQAALLLTTTKQYNQTLEYVRNAFTQYAIDGDSDASSDLSTNYGSFE